MRRSAAHRHGLARVPVLAAVLLMIGVLSPAAVHAHANLVASEPLNDAVLAAAPAMLTLTFDEAVEPLLIRIVDADGHATVVSRIDRRGASLIFAAPSGLARGGHVVSWRVISADGHPVGGSFAFWIGARGAALPDVAGSESPAIRVMIWATRLALYLGLFVGAGGAFFLAWFRPGDPARGPRVVCAAASIAGLLSCALSIGLQGLDALAAPPSALLLPTVWQTGIHGSFGWAAAVAMATLLLALLSLRGPAPLAKILTLAGLLGTGLALAVTGHAATAPPRALTAPAVFLHGVSLAFWIGALWPLADALREGSPAAIGVLKRFSRAIPLAIALLLASGVAIAVVQLGRVDALWSTAYGRVLAIKIVLVLVLLGIALFNRRVLTPKFVAAQDASSPRRLRRAIVAECVLVVAVLGVVALWRFTPPPRALAAAESAFTHIHTGRVMANVTITPGRAGPLDIRVELETPDETPMSALAVSVTLSNPVAGIEPATIVAKRVGDSEWAAAFAAPVAGRWTLGLDILVSDFDKIAVEAPITLK